MKLTVRKPIQALTIIVAFLFTPLLALAETCPSDVIAPYEGRWQGKVLFVPTEGNPQIQPGTKDEFRRIDCNSFQVSIDCLDGNGKSVRQVLFKAEASLQNLDLFTIDGTVTEANKNVSPMKGFMHVIESGTLLATFESAFGGKIAYFTELINI